MSSPIAATSIAIDRTQNAIRATSAVLGVTETAFLDPEDAVPGISNDVVATFDSIASS